MSVMTLSILRYIDPILRTQSSGYAYRDKICVCAFIRVNVHARLYYVSTEEKENVIP